MFTNKDYDKIREAWSKARSSLVTVMITVHQLSPEQALMFVQAVDQTVAAWNDFSTVEEDDDGKSSPILFQLTEIE